MAWLWIALASLLTGFFLMKTGRKPVARTLVWFIPALDIVAGYCYLTTEKPGYKMLVLIFLLFLGMKAVTAVYRYHGKGRLSFIQWLAFALGWPGMDPLPFEQLGKLKTGSGRSNLVTGLISIVAGSILLYLLALLLRHQLLPAFLVCLLSFLPLVMIFHSGIFNIGAAVWGWLGVQVSPLMDAPWKSENLGSFWGKRWNIAFIQMTRIALFVPMAKRGKPMQALLLSFLISGIFHEVALTLPVGKGYGLPLLYFLLQAMLVLAERRFITKWSRPARAVWTFGCLLLPFPLLLHPAFLDQVLLPFLQSLAL